MASNQDRTIRIRWRRLEEMQGYNRISSAPHISDPTATIYPTPTMPVVRQPRPGGQPPSQSRPAPLTVERKNRWSLAAGPCLEKLYVARHTVEVFPQPHW